MLIHLHEMKVMRDNDNIRRQVKTQMTSSWNSLSEASVALLSNACGIDNNYVRSGNAGRMKS